MTNHNKKHTISIDVMHTVQDIEMIRHLLNKIEHRIQQGLLPADDNINGKLQQEEKDD